MHQVTLKSCAFTNLPNQMHTGQACTWFLEIAFVREIGLCVCSAPTTGPTTHQTSSTAFQFLCNICYQYYG